MACHLNQLVVCVTAGAQHSLTTSNSTILVPVNHTVSHFSPTMVTNTVLYEQDNKLPQLTVMWGPGRHNGSGSEIAWG